MKNLIDIDHKDIFILPQELRKELVEKGTNLFLRQCELNASLTGKKLGTIISNNMANLDFRIQELKEDEEYELCYYLSEVLWQTHTIVQKSRKDEGI